jgi:pimeloyl-ACP methyl ester carboxylesterase
MMHGASRSGSWWPYAAGLVSGAAAMVLVRSLAPRPALDARLLRRGLRRDQPPTPPTILVPGILGSELVRPDGTQVWLNLRTTVGAFDLSLPAVLPLSESRDDLVPAGLLGVDAALPRLFGFTEYADFLELLGDAGFGTGGRDPAKHVFTYDWRRDLVESARRLGEALDRLAEASGDPEARFNLVGHSMGGLVARYYLRYGAAEPGGDVTWAGARRIENLVLVATPNGGSSPALDALLNGNRVGLSSTTLAPSVVAHMPSLYQLLPPQEAHPLVDPQGDPLAMDPRDPETWRELRWGPWAVVPRRRRGEEPRSLDPDAEKAFLCAVLDRARAVHDALARPPLTRCPARVLLLGGDCLATPARAIVTGPGQPPRFDAWTQDEAEFLQEAGDGRVTRASVLASHLPDADPDEPGCGLHEVSRTLFGSADHHGIYSEPTFQSVLLRVLLRPAARRYPSVAEASGNE